MATKPYHLLFSEIKPSVLDIVRATIKSGLFKKDNSIKNKEQLIADLNVILCNLYNIPRSIVVFTGNNYYPFAPCYNIINKTIILTKLSLVSYLHEFYHHLASFDNSFTNNEINARGFSHSVFYLATPKLFQNALNKNLLIFENSNGNKTGE